MARLQDPSGQRAVDRRRTVRLVLAMSWASLVWMTAEGAVGAERAENLNSSWIVA